MAYGLQFASLGFAKYWQNRRSDKGTRSVFSEESQPRQSWRWNWPWRDGDIPTECKDKKISCASQRLSSSNCSIWQNPHKQDPQQLTSPLSSILPLASGGNIGERTVLVSGLRGCGKSACVNAIAGKEIFAKSPFAQSAKASLELEQCRVKLPEPFCCNLIFVEMPYLSDKDLAITHQTSRDQLCRELYGAAPAGFDHVLFVYSGRFTREDESYFAFIRNALFVDDELMKKSLTIVRTRTSFCKDSAKCEEEVALLEKISSKARSMVQCAGAVIHIDLPDEYSLDWERMRQFGRDKLLERVLASGRGKMRIAEGLSVRIDEFMAPSRRSEEELLADLARLQDAAEDVAGRIRVLGSDLLERCNFEDGNLKSIECGTPECTVEQSVPTALFWRCHTKTEWTDVEVGYARLDNRQKHPGGHFGRKKLRLGKKNLFSVCQNHGITSRLSWGNILL